MYLNQAEFRAEIADAAKYLSPAHVVDRYQSLTPNALGTSTGIMMHEMFQAIVAADCDRGRTDMDAAIVS